jgi:ADP-ribosyl-[dinitrogen reductase] hydrolase
MKQIILLFIMFFWSACVYQSEEKAQKDSEISDLTKVPKASFAKLRFEQREKELPQGTEMINFTIFSNNKVFQDAKNKVQSYIKNIDKEKMSQAEDRAIAAMLGMAVGDALGAPFEFLPYIANALWSPGWKGYVRAGNIVDGNSTIVDGKILNTMTKDSYINYDQNNKQLKEHFNRFAVSPGQWTDDTSMGLALADTLLMNKGVLDQSQVMWAFHDWWFNGYDNAFALSSRPNKGGIGLGGNIGQSLKAFSELNLSRDAHGPLPTTAGDKNTSGNGSLMRNCPSALVAKSLEEAQKIASEQSLVTHQGEEARALSELMSAIIYKALHDPSDDPNIIKANLITYIRKYKSDISSVNKLVKPEIKSFWDWRNDFFDFDEERTRRDPSYIGSYAVDAMLKALHCVWTTESFDQAVLKAISRGGDADSVGAITGQIAGAIYGVKNIPKEWIEAIQQWDRNGEIAARGYLLLHARE